MAGAADGTLAPASRAGTEPGGELQHEFFEHDTLAIEKPVEPVPGALGLGRPFLGLLFGNASQGVQQGGELPHPAGTGGQKRRQAHGLQLGPVPDLVRRAVGPVLQFPHYPL